VCFIATQESDLLIVYFQKQNMQLSGLSL